MNDFLKVITFIMELIILISPKDKTKKINAPVSSVPKTSVIKKLTKPPEPTIELTEPVAVQPEKKTERATPMQSKPKKPVFQFIAVILLLLILALFAGVIAAKVLPGTKPVPAAVPSLMPTPGSTATNEPNLIQAFGDETYYIQKTGAILYTCASLDCHTMTVLSGGSAVMVNAYIKGDAINTGNNVWFRSSYNGQPAYIYSGFVYSISATAAPNYPTAFPTAPSYTYSSSSDYSSNYTSSTSSSGGSCPSSCAGARASGMSASAAAACGLDGDGDGVACYGD